MKKYLTTKFALAVLPALILAACDSGGNGSDENQCQISGVLLEEANLTSDIDWYLEGGFVIGSGESSARLTIEGGTVIRGDNVDATDYVLVSDNIVVNGVDENTRLTFVQSHNSARDGLHILNSTARMSWILVTGAERDGIWYRDFSGLIKDLMVIHNRDADGSTGRSGIYASETTEGDSNPRIVNASLIGRDAASESAGDTDNEFGILFADNTDQIRMANVLIANFRNGCFEVDSAANLDQIDQTIPGRCCC